MDLEGYAALLHGPGHPQHSVIALVVGYARAGPYRHDDPGESPSIGELWGIHVDPDHWGNGYGQALMTVGIRQLRSAGYETAHLWVFRENARARRFYEASGWEADGAIKALQIGTLPPVLLEEVRYSRRIGAVQT